MQNIMLNMRIKKILQRICEKSEYVTIASIARELNVSNKTVLRDIPEAEQWLNEKGCYLDKKAGLGIRLNCTDEKRGELLEILNGVKGQESYTPMERRTMVVSELLQSAEPVKLFSFTRRLKVTESTISNDLDKAEEWFLRFGIRLVRKQGLGVYLEGSEASKRRAIIGLIHENADDNQLLQLLHKNQQEKQQPSVELAFLVKTRLLDLIDYDFIRKLQVLIAEVQKEMNYTLSDNAFIGLAVHLSLSVKRNMKGEVINIGSELLEQLKAKDEYRIAKRLMEKIAQAFHIQASDQEIGYITMHMSGYRDYGNADAGKVKALGNYQLVRIVKEIIKIAENETGCLLEQDERLLVGLVNHLGPAINRLKMGLDIRNPLLENIKTHYSELLKVSEKCMMAVQDQIGVLMPESEIAYIAMHIGAAIENQGVRTKRIYRVVVACSAGIGTSMILATRLKSEYDNLQVVDTISTLRFDENNLRDEEIDFIISTVKMEGDGIPIVTINPLLFEEDKTKISNLIKSLESDNRSIGRKNKRNKNFKEKLHALQDYGNAILQILDNFFLEEDIESSSILDLVGRIGGIIENHGEGGKAEPVKEALLAREEKGSILITGHEAILFHCRAEVIEKLHFGVVRIGQEIKVPNVTGELERIKLGVVMIAPEGCPKHHIEVISHVSKMLLEKPDFISILKNGEWNEAYNELSNVLRDFYKAKVNS